MLNIKGGNDMPNQVLGKWTVFVSRDDINLRTFSLRKEREGGKYPTGSNGQNSLCFCSRGTIIIMSSSSLALPTALSHHHKEATLYRTAPQKEIR